ncbi:MAG: cell wall-binding repeat-containing protein [Candidatus Nanosalina sp.]
MKHKKLTVLAVFALVTGLGLAQNATNDTNVTDPGMQENVTGVNTVIIASSESHTDGVVAGAASERIGAPVLLTGPDSLPDATAQVLEEQNFERAVIVGGTAAISPEVEEEIGSIVGDTERVAGETASDTSLEVADAFWRDTGEAVVVQASLMEDRERTYRLASAAANLGEPVILADEDSDIGSELREQGINQVTVYSLTGAEDRTQGSENTAAENHAENMTGNETQFENQTATPETPQGQTGLAQSLEQAGITAEVNTGSVEEPGSQIYSRIQDNAENRSMYAVTGAEFRYGLPAYAHPNAATYVVTDENLREDIQYLQNSGYNSITVIGEQNLGQQITGELEDAEYVQVDSPAETAAEIFRNNTQQWTALQGEAEINQTGNTTENQTENMTAEDRNETLTPPVTEDGNTTMEQNNTETTENQTGNETVPENQDTGTEINLSSSGNTMTAEASYTSETPYRQVEKVQQNGSEVVFTFELIPENETGTGQQTYNFGENIELEPGNYTATARLVADGQTVKQETEEITIG